VILNKVITGKYFASNFSKFEELDRGYTLKKNWKERMRLLNELFQSAFEHPGEFEGSANVKKYFQIAIEQIDEKNPGLLINAVNNLIRSLDCFPGVLEEHLGNILEKVIPVFETRRGEIIAVAGKLLGKIYGKYDANRVAREYLRMLVGGSKAKGEILSQLLIVLRDNEQKENEHRSIREIPL
jgi:hypothetical protein